MDGSPDIVVTNLCPSSGNCDRSVVGVLLGNGDGTFQEPRTYDSGGYQAQALAMSDVSGDGKPDLIVTHWCPACDVNDDAVVSVLLGKGDGTFEAAQNYDSGGWARSVAVGDMNRDGKPDLLVANDSATGCLSGGAVGVLLGNGDGTFQTVRTYCSGRGFHAFAVSLGDVNGDGRLDVVAANQCIDNHCVYGSGGVLLGNGDGTFQEAQSYNSGGQYANSVAVADVNLDGNLDVLVANEVVPNQPGIADGVLGVLLGNGDGTFQKPRTYDSGAKFANSVAARDVNEDGRPDLLVVNRCIRGRCTEGGTVGVLLRRGNTTTNLDSSQNPSVYGQAITLTATVNSDGPIVPTGTVVFKNLDKWLGKVTLDGGVATLNKTNLPAGALWITASYNGDVHSPKSTSAPVNQLVNQATSTTTTISSVNPTAQGQPVTFTANVTSLTARATGTVTFTAGGTMLGSASLSWGGKASVTTSALPKGSNTITATYNGTANILGSTGSIIQIVK